MKFINRKHETVFLTSYSIVPVDTQVEVWENKKCCGNTSHMQVFVQLF